MLCTSGSGSLRIESPCSTCFLRLGRDVATHREWQRSSIRHIESLRPIRDNKVARRSTYVTGLRRRPGLALTLAAVILFCVGITPALGATTTQLAGADMSLLWALPFAGLLISIATGPVLYPHLWEHHYGKFSLGWCALAVVPLLVWAGPSLAVGALLHTLLLEYLPFIILLLALYTVAGGVLVEGNIRGTPMTNVGILVVGALLASLVGTTGAAMIMIRPLIRANRNRPFNAHVVIFFIFVVCNIGGALTPLGDPPIFVGFLRGVGFFWPLRHLLVETATVAALVLTVFMVIDGYLYVQERRHARAEKPMPKSPARLLGWVNLPLFGGIIAAILLSAIWHPGISFMVNGSEVKLQNATRDVIMIVMAILSLVLSPRECHRVNDFKWGPIVEVATLFAAIFICLVPVGAMLRAGQHGALASLFALVTKPDGSADPLAYFWLSGALSSFLDNTPTYLVFFDLAGGNPEYLMSSGAAVLTALSTGAVFMGANTYIGNAPNFMVYAIARDGGVRMPHFFGYMLWSVGILIPIYLFTGWLFFG